MEDFLKQKIEIGDQVIYGKSSRNGGLSGPHEVVEISEHRVGIATRHWKGHDIKTNVTPERLVIIKKNT